MMRRLLGTLGGIALALGLVAAPVIAQEPPNPNEAQGQWTGTSISAEGSGVKGTLRWRANLTRTTVNRFEVQLRTPDAAPSQEGCPLPDPAHPQTFEVASTALGDRRFEGTFTRGLETACNGRYTVQTTVLAHWTWRFSQSSQPANGTDTWTSGTVEVTVARSAGPARELGAERVDDGRVRLGWKAPSGVPHDFLGYAVDRVDEDGTVTRLAGSTTSTGLTDATADPDQALEYRVVTLREGPGGPGTPPIESEPATVGVEGPPEPEPSTTTTEADSDEVADAGTQGGGGAAPQVSRPRTGTSRPRIGPAPSVTPTTIDTGFDESLPFDPDRMVGPRDAVVPDDEFASLIFDDPEGGAGLAVPGATAAVLAVWAMHLHHLNRLARQDP